MRAQGPIPAFKARIGNVIRAMTAFRTGGYQFALRDAGQLMALFAAVIRGFTRDFSRFLAHADLGADCPKPTQRRAWRSARDLYCDSSPMV